MVAYTVKKILDILSRCCLKTFPLVHLLGHKNPVNLTSILFIIHFNINLILCCVFKVVSYLLIFLLKPFLRFSSSLACHMCRSSHLTRFVHPNDIWLKNASSNAVPAPELAP